LNSTSKRIALVTGANKGIGFEIARQMAQSGVSVLMGARKPERGIAAAEQLIAGGLDVAFIQLDLDDGASVAAAAANVETEHGRLDILVNNAGVAPPGDGAPSVPSLDVVRRVFETNFFGTLAVTQAMLPLLRKSAAGRIINMSSGLGSLTLNGDPSNPFYEVRLIGYNASKAALNMLTIQLSAELRGSSVTVDSVCPGLTKTDLSGHRGEQSPAAAAITPVKFALMAEGKSSGKFVNADGELPW
jgi:NAD(P)-dependent dehydrogenase (short-subunit alcohol dehydrogenase family)